MSAFIFLGPTLSPDEAGTELDAVYLPPVAQGDVYRVTGEQPRAIGIVDGYFENQPAVWHKEILWALQKGVRVYGSASMGALRAAELSAFGMIGVGNIFAAFRDGELEDDDEVAIVHASQEVAFRPLSEPMVNIRATVLLAERVGVLSAESARVLCRLAKARHFSERSYGELLKDARHAGLDADADRLRDWLPQHRIDLKREDAIEMLRKMRCDLAADHAFRRAGFQFEYTHFWHQARLTDFAFGGDHSVVVSSSTAGVLEEAALTGAFQQARGLALSRTLALLDADHQGLAQSEEAVLATGARFRAERGLGAAEDLKGWLTKNELEPDSFIRLIEEEAAISAVTKQLESEIGRGLLHALRISNRYELLAARAEEKRRMLLQHGLYEADLESTGCNEEELLRWFFERHLALTMPSDFEDYARSAGFSDTTGLRRAIVREWHYVTLHQSDHTSGPSTSATARPTGLGLEPGDPAPPFLLRTGQSETIGLDDFAGRSVLLVFLPRDAPIAPRELVVSLVARTEHEGVALVTVSPDGRTNRALDGAAGDHLIDTDGVVARRYDHRSRHFSRAFLLDPALRIEWAGELATPSDVPWDDVAGTVGLRAESAAAVEPPHAPVLVVPRVFDAVLCEELIELWETGGHERTGVNVQTGTGVRTVLNADYKQRQDHEVRSGPVADRLMELIDRRVRPELLKAFQYDAGPWGEARIGSYSAEEGGFFRPHRDDAMATSTRKFTLAINLNVGGYEGGVVRFSEYCPRAYQPKTGAALIFSASLLHEVTPVTSGTRFVFLARCPPES